MKLLEQIEKFDISFEQLSGLTNDRIDLIEEKLRRKVALNERFNKKEIGQLISFLRKEKENIATLFQEDFEPFLHILKSNVESVRGNNHRVKSLDFKDDFIRFLSENFEDKLRKVAEQCLISGNYYALYALLKFDIILSSDLLQFIYQKMNEVLNDLIERAQIDSEQFKTDTIPATNPFFFRCLNKLYPVRFELNISTFLDLVIKKTENEDWGFRILYALGNFNAKNFNTQHLLRDNKDKAYHAGVREVHYPKDKLDGSGEVRLEKNKKEKTFALLKFFPLFILVINVVVVIILVQYSEYISSENSKKMFNSPKLEGAMSHLDKTKVDLLNFLHSDSVNIIEQKDIEFNIENCDLPFSQAEIGTELPIEIKNETEFNLMLIAHHFGNFTSNFYCLSPKESIKIPDLLMGIRVYAGSVPQIIKYVNAQGDTLSHFRFNNFSVENEQNFNFYHHINPVNNKSSKTEIRIELENSSFVLKKEEL